MAPHSSTFAWKIPWTEGPGGLQSMGSLGVGHDWATSLSLSCIGEGTGNPIQCSCLENLRDGGAWWAAVYGVAQSRTWLKRLSSSSMKNLLRVSYFSESFFIYCLLLRLELQFLWMWLQELQWATFVDWQLSWKLVLKYHVHSISHCGAHYIFSALKVFEQLLAKSSKIQLDV